MSYRLLCKCGNLYSPTVILIQLGCIYTYYVTRILIPESLDRVSGRLDLSQSPYVTAMMECHDERPWWNAMMESHDGYLWWNAIMECHDGLPWWGVLIVHFLSLAQPMVVNECNLRQYINEILFMFNNGDTYFPHWSQGLWECITIDLAVLELEQPVVLVIE